MKGFSRLLPKGISSRLKKYLKEKLSYELLLDRSHIESSIPKINLQRKHIQNLQIVLDRNELLSKMPRNGVCAEIGVDKGEFSDLILKETNPIKLHLIDAWGDSKRYHDELKGLVRERFGKQINEGTIEMNVGFSTEVLKTFPDRYFDWVYLDTDHTYLTTSNELDILKSKVKEGGIIAGHDYTIGNWVAAFRYGVIEAVHELCVSSEWELIYLTNETHQCRSFAVRKLQ